jgi:hypothetical protein
MRFYEAPRYTREALAGMPDADVRYPFTDEYAQYIGSDHQYELKKAYFAENGISLDSRFKDSPDDINAFLKMLRKKVYGYLYAATLTPRAAVNYKIAKGLARGASPWEFREDFLYLMLLEGEYLLNNGDIGEVGGVDFAIMQNMSVDVMRRENRDFSLMCGRVIKSLNLDYAGYNGYIIPAGKDW